MLPQGLKQGFLDKVGWHALLFLALGLYFFAPWNKRSEFLWNAWLGLVCLVAGAWLSWKWLVSSPHKKWDAEQGF